MTSDESVGDTPQWVFECQVGTCSGYAEADNEVEALDACGSHADITGHFDFEIRSPRGEVAYP